MVPITREFIFIQCSLVSSHSSNREPSETVTIIRPFTFSCFVVRVNHNIKENVCLQSTPCARSLHCCGEGPKAVLRWTEPYRIPSSAN